MQVYLLRSETWLNTGDRGCGNNSIKNIEEKYFRGTVIAEILHRCGVLGHQVKISGSYSGTKNRIMSPKLVLFIELVSIL